MREDVHRLQAACLAGGYIVRVASLEQARAAQEYGAVGVLIDRDAKLEASHLSQMLDVLSIHIMCGVRHREALLKAYERHSDISRPGHFTVTRSWKGMNLKWDPILPLVGNHEEIREAVDRGAALVILDHHELQDLEPELRAYDGGARPTVFAQVDDMDQAVAALEKGLDGLLLNFLPGQGQLPRLRRAMVASSNVKILDTHRFLIGVVALQGDYQLQIKTLETLLLDSYRDRKDEFQVAAIRTREEVSTCDALLLPGGWSNLQSALMDQTGLATGILEHQRLGKPVLAVCAGMVLAGSRPGRDCEDRRLLGLIDVRIENNVLHGERCVS
jgi:hypothetical protein